MRLSTRVSAPTPISRNRVTPSASPASRAALGAKYWFRPAGSGRPSGGSACADGNRPVLSFKVIVPAASEACFSRAETRSHSGHRVCASAAASASSCAKVVSAEIVCAGACASTARPSSPRARRRQPRADPAVPCSELALAEPGELADQGDAVAGQAPLHRRTHAPQHRYRFVGKEGGGIAAAQHRKAARLVEIGGELGEELVVAQPDRHGDAELGFNAAGEPREELGGARAVELLGAAEVEKGFVDRQRLDQLASAAASRRAPRVRPRDISPCPAGSRPHRGRRPAP